MKFVFLIWSEMVRNLEIRAKESEVCFLKLSGPINIYEMVTKYVDVLQVHKFITNMGDK